VIGRHVVPSTYPTAHSTRLSNGSIAGAAGADHPSFAHGKSGGAQSLMSAPVG
jgi:hypothetical protein